jgi:ABC-type sugar transport system substrate-binding protein
LHILAAPDIALHGECASALFFDQARRFLDASFSRDPARYRAVADGMPTTGLNIMTDLITANPDLRGVFASNLTMAQGAGQAIAENKVSDKIMLIGFDSDDKLSSF